MKLKKVSFRSMNPLHTYITKDCGVIYKVHKTYSDKNVIISKYKCRKGGNLSDFEIYYLEEYIKISENENLVLDLIDLGSKQVFSVKTDKLVFVDVDKAIEKLNRFIANINIEIKQ